MDMLTISDWPLVCGWNDLLMLRRKPASLNKFFQTLLLKIGSQSLTMEDGNPCSHTLSSKKALATDVVV